MTWAGSTVGVETESVPRGRAASVSVCPAMLIFLIKTMVSSVPSGTSSNAWLSGDVATYPSFERKLKNVAGTRGSLGSIVPSCLS